MLGVVNMLGSLLTYGLGHIHSSHLYSYQVSVAHMFLAEQDISHLLDHILVLRLPYHSHIHLLFVSEPPPSDRE